jgi:hypothetical protein
MALRMRIVLPPLLLASSIASTAAAQTDPSDDACQVTLHSAPGFGGDHACLGKGTYTRADLRAAGFSGTSVGSVTLDLGHRVTVRDEAGGAYETTQVDEAVDGVRGPRPLASVTVEECTAGLFKDAAGHVGGRCLGPGSYDAKDLASLGIAPGSVRSVSVAPRYELTLVRRQGTTTLTDVLTFLSPPLSTPGATIVSAKVAPAQPPSQPPKKRVPRKREPASAAFKNVYILGDSLSDQTNMWNSYLSYFLLCPNPAYGYYEGRFTNGQNWVDYLTDDNPGIGGMLTNKAVGGSKALTSAVFRPSLMQQAQTLPTADGADDALVIIWDGSNDVNGEAQGYKGGTGTSSGGGGGGGGGTGDPQTDGQTFGQLLAEQIEIVEAWLSVNRNVRHDIVAELPPIQIVPIIRTPAYADSPAKQTYLAAAVTAANQGIDAPRVPANVEVTVVPMDSFISGLINGGGWANYMTDVTDACQVLGNLNACSFAYSRSYVDKPCPQKMFMDQLHPSSLAHCGLAGEFEQAMTQAGVASVNVGSSEQTCPTKEQVPDRAPPAGGQGQAPPGGWCPGDRANGQPQTVDQSAHVRVFAVCPNKPPSPGCGVARGPASGAIGSAAGVALVGLAFAKRRGAKRRAARREGA